MNNHEHQTKQTYESYTFQALMSFMISVAYYATCVTYFSCPKKGCTYVLYTRAEQSTKLSGLCLS